MRRYFLIMLSFISGVAWLYPVYTLPRSDELVGSGVFIYRMLRIICPAFIAIIYINKVLAGLLNKKTYLMVFMSLIVLPLCCTIIFPDINYASYVVLPIVASGIALLGLLSLSDQDMNLWISTIGFVSFMFIIAGIFKYGFDMTSYYGRPRLHLGFVHPTQTASALLAAIMCLIVNLNRYKSLALKVIIYSLLSLLILLLYYAGSRNTLLCLITSFSGYMVFRFITNIYIKKMYVLFILLLVVVVHFIAILLDIQNGIGLLADQSSSGRLRIILELFQSLDSSNWYDWVLGPSAFIINKTNDAASLGFAVIDSVYISDLLNYGALQLIFFMWLLLFTGFKLTRNRNISYIAIWTAIVIYFALDAQGVTASNLIIFSFLAISLRGATSHTSNLRNTKIPQIS